MKYVRFQKSGRSWWGILEGEVISPLMGAPWETRELSGEYPLLGDVFLLPPTEPANIFCVGLNYADHAEESGCELPEEPHIFLKGTNSSWSTKARSLFPTGQEGSTTRVSLLL